MAAKPGSVRGQAQFFEGTPAGTWQRRLAGSTRIGASPARLPPASGRGQGCLGLYLAACAAGPGARRAMPGDRDWRGGTDQRWRGSLAIGTRPHPPPTSAGPSKDQHDHENQHVHGIKITIFWTIFFQNKYSLDSLHKVITIKNSTVKRSGMWPLLTSEWFYWEGFTDGCFQILYFFRPNEPSGGV